MPGLRPVVLPIFDDRWIELFETSHDSLIFHHPAWSVVLSDTYRLPSFVLGIEDEDGALVAGLPMLDLSRHHRTPRWVSLPFSDRCPPLTRTCDVDVGGPLRSLAAERRFERLEVRGQVVDGTSVPAGVNHILDLDGQLDPSQKIHKSHRRHLQTAQRAGLRTTVGAGDRDLSVFYELHVSTRRAQGVPVQPRRFFDRLQEHLLARRLGFVLTVYSGRRPLAAAVFLAWKRTLFYKYAAADMARRETRSSYLLAWSGIELAHDAGFQSVDFGRSKSSQDGLRRFKKGWGAAESPLSYSSFGRKATGSRDNARAAAALAATIRSSPPFVTRLAGELLYGFSA